MQNAKARETMQQKLVEWIEELVPGYLTQEEANAAIEELDSMSYWDIAKMYSAWKP